MVIAGVVAVAVLVVCGLFSWGVFQDELAGKADGARNEPSGAPMRDISSREGDPEPLTVDEVFPSEQIVINADENPYEVLGTEATEDCSVAVADALSDLLAELDCTQVVRATLRSPNGEYLVTTGIFNLATRDQAVRAYEEIPPIVDEQTGRFVGLLAGEGTEPIMISETRLGWDYRGHYLMYAVVAKADGTDFGADDDRYAQLIIWDMVEVHLRTGVLEARANLPAPSGSPQPSPSSSDGG
ncbi:MAG: hypothetical protein FWJ70_16350 [Micromonosporaceae bacterium]|jgi:hypothetical protein